MRHAALCVPRVPTQECRKCRIIDAATHHSRLLGLKPSGEKQDDEDDQDDAEDADAAMTIAVAVAAEATTESTEQRDDEDDDEDESERRHSGQSLSPEFRAGERAIVWFFGIHDNKALLRR